MMQVIRERFCEVRRCLILERELTLGGMEEGKVGRRGGLIGCERFCRGRVFFRSSVRSEIVRKGFYFGAIPESHLKSFNQGKYGF